MMRRIILVTGTPCVGKTTISKMLSSRLGAVHIDLTELVRREGLTCGVDQDRGTLIADLERVSQRIRQILRGHEGTVIIDGHYAAHVVPPEEVHKVFVLRRDPAELKEVMMRRGYRHRKLWENLAAEILDVCLWEAIERCGIERVCEVDVSGRDPEEVVEEILSILSGGRACRVRVVDWLGKLEEEGKLEEYLRENFNQPEG